MLKKLKSHLDEIITLLFEIGEYQLQRQGQVSVQSKSLHKGIDKAWSDNEVFSEVDLWSEQQLLEFFRSRFHSSDFCFITEESYSTTSSNTQYYVVIDPLDGTKPYLQGKKTFGISLGVCTREKFLFGCNYYPAFHQLIYAFDDLEGVYNQERQQIQAPERWESNCSVTSQFSYLVNDDTFKEHFIESALGLTFVIIPDCAIYRFKLIMEGVLSAYFSEHIFLWDIGPSTLLMEKIGARMVNPVDSSPVNIRDLLIPPFMQTVLLAAPEEKLNTMCSKFRSLQKPCSH